jgi:uncharacterized protein (UPF0548 family)
MKIVLKEVECEVVGCTDVGQGRDQWRNLVNAVMNLRVSQKAGYFLTAVSSSRRTFSDLDRFSVLCAEL